MIEGPSGTGKEVVAEALHKLSTRSRRAFVAINCAAIPEALLEAELFGHTRGAFTGAVQGRIGRIESADGGTLFLDEIEKCRWACRPSCCVLWNVGSCNASETTRTQRSTCGLSPQRISRLLRRPRRGSFRADLYYRLAVFLVHTPALADHIEDLPLLVDHFLERMGRDRPVKRIDESAMEKLRAHPWPGNVRELEHVLERAAILAGDEPMMTAAEIDFGQPTSRGGQELQAG